MSFSSEVKQEIISHAESKRHCKIAELMALICCCGMYDEQNSLLIFRSEHFGTLKKYTTFLADLFGKIYNSDKSSVYVFGDSARKVLAVTGFIKDNIYSKKADLLVINSACCKRAFIRGSFICCGSLCDPEKNYHLEFSCHDCNTAEILMNTINYFGLDSKTIKRKNNYIVYLKESESIVELLNIMAANNAYLQLENMRVLKDVRNSVNRKVNCETANLNKVVSAAVTQIDAIEYIRATRGLEHLPTPLREVAEIRLEYPDMSLKEIGETLTPPVGKSGVNHRFKKIISIANNLRGGQ